MPMRLPPSSQSMGGSEAMQAASYLVYSCQHLNRPQEVIAKVFGDNFAALAVETTKLVHVQKQARSATAHAHLADGAGTQTENVRKMLLAFSRDLRVVMLRLASRLQTLRHTRQPARRPPPENVARESLQVFAPLANRLGIWQVKWEIEDLSFRFLEPETYKLIARLLDEKRIEREGYVEQLRARLERELAAEGIKATVQGRPKNIYSIVKKMRGKSLDFAQVFDMCALRVVVADVKDCYAALGVGAFALPADRRESSTTTSPGPSRTATSRCTPSCATTAGPAPIEIQIRTEAMHDHAEHGVAAHWAYKEAGTRAMPACGPAASTTRRSPCCGNCWPGSATSRGGSAGGKGLFEDRIYVLTPDAAIVELPQGATPVDFAYTRAHRAWATAAAARASTARWCRSTRRCRTARRWRSSPPRRAGRRATGSTRNWAYLASHRAQAKVRAWFNAQITQETVARGREVVEKLLQREGKTALKLDDLAAQLGLQVGRRPVRRGGQGRVLAAQHRDAAAGRPSRAGAGRRRPAQEGARQRAARPRAACWWSASTSLMTQLAKCCKPAPPDAIRGFVTQRQGREHPPHATAATSARWRRAAPSA